MRLCQCLGPSVLFPRGAQSVDGDADAFHAVVGCFRWNEGNA